MFFFYSTEDVLNSLANFHIEKATIATFADVTALLAVDDNVLEATNKLQRAIDKVSERTKRWRIKLNEAKSTHINWYLQKS